MTSSLYAHSLHTVTPSLYAHSLHTVTSTLYAACTPRVVLVPTDSVDCVEAVYQGVLVCSLAPGVEKYCDPTDEGELDEHVDRIIGVVSEFHRSNYCEWPLAHNPANAMWAGA